MRFTVWGVVYGGGTGGKGIGNKYNKNPKTYLGFIIIYFRVGFLILLFTYVNLYL